MPFQLVVAIDTTCRFAYLASHFVITIPAAWNFITEFAVRIGGNLL